MAKLHYPEPASVSAEISRHDLRLLLSRLGSRLGYGCPEDWYSLQVADLKVMPGLLAVVQNPIRAGRIVHPDLNPLLFECRKHS